MADDWYRTTAELLDFRKEDHNRIEEVTEVRVEGARVLCGARTASGEPVFAAIDVCSDPVLRLRVSAAPVEDRSTLMVVKDRWDPVPFDVEDGEGEVAVSTPSLRLSIGKSPWRVRLLDGVGRELFAEEREDRRSFGTSYVTFPLGFVSGEGPTRTVGAFRLAPDEEFYGFGEKFGPLGKRGRAIRCFNRGSGTWTEGEHKNVPFLVSSRGYGAFFNSSRPMLFDMGAKSNAAWAFAVADGLLDVFFIRGPSFKDIISGYTEITGRPELPPDWVFGIWMSRYTYRSREEVEEVASRLRAEGLPCDVIKIDTGWFHKPGRGSAIDYDMEWNEEAWPGPEEFTARLREEGFRVCLFVDPYVMAESPKAREARRLGFLVRRPDGTEHSWDMGQGCPVVQFDLTSPDCRVWYKKQLKILLDQGVSTFFCDWGVDTPVDCVYAGMDGLEYNNVCGLLYNKTVHEAVREHSGGPTATWGVSGYAGIQRYPATYGGDSRSTFRDMANVLRGALSAAMSGISFYGCDIGGYGHAKQGSPDETLYIRYLQHGFFLPLAQFHGMGPREPWAYGERATRVYKEYAELRYRLLPYIRSQAYLSCLTGVPMLRPMVLEFQDDPNTRHLDLQYMFGEAFLVAPVFGPETARRVYLPEGTWFDYWTKEPREGSAWVEYEAPLERLPLLVRAGSIVPMGPAAQCVDEKPRGPLVLDVYPSRSDFTATLFDAGAARELRGRPESDRLTVSVGGVAGECHVLIHGLSSPSGVSVGARALPRCEPVELADAREAWSGGPGQALRIRARLGGTEEITARLRDG
jgi:alpha-D-xyloside xylohydrolase